MTVESHIVKESKQKYWTENKYWEFNPNSIYLGTITLRVEMLYAPTTMEHYDLGIWISEDKTSCSLVFLQDNDYTAYHSVPAYIKSKHTDFDQHWGFITKHPITVINNRIIELAREQGLLNSFESEPTSISQLK